MGLLYTTEGTRRILDTLNTAFDGPDQDASGKDKGLAIVRTAKDNDSLLKGMLTSNPRKWKPGHLATALQLLPFDQSGNGAPVDDSHTKRWAYFLKKVVGAQQFSDLRDALADAILDQVTGRPIGKISFDHVEVTNVSNANLVVFDAPMPDFPGKWVRHITLFTKRLKDSDSDSLDGTGSGEPNPLPGPPWKTS